MGSNPAPTTVVGCGWRTGPRSCCPSCARPHGTGSYALQDQQRRSAVRPQQYFRQPSELDATAALTSVFIEQPSSFRVPTPRCEKCEKTAVVTFAGDWPRTPRGNTGGAAKFPATSGNHHNQRHDQRISSTTVSTRDYQRPGRLISTRSHPSRSGVRVPLAPPAKRGFEA